MSKIRKGKKEREWKKEGKLEDGEGGDRWKGSENRKERSREEDKESFRK